MIFASPIKVPIPFMLNVHCRVFNEISRGIPKIGLIRDLFLKEADLH